MRPSTVKPSTALATLAAVAAVAGAARARGLWRARAERADEQARNLIAKIDFWSARALRAEGDLSDYERAMGLPYWDREQTTNDLWVRAANGDEIAREVIQSRAERERNTALSSAQAEELESSAGLAID